MVHGGKGIHQVLIRIFRSLYRIKWDDISSFQRLGDFFLRDVSFNLSKRALVCPVECQVLEGPAKIKLDEEISVKGIRYRWEGMPEFESASLSNGTFWNFYLAPSLLSLDSLTVRRRRDGGLSP